MDNEIEEFIHRRFQQDCNWMNGNCYYMALILSTRFSYLDIVYMPVEGHFVASADMLVYYDSRGKHIADAEDKLIRLSDIEKQDPLWFSRIYDGCIK